VTNARRDGLYLVLLGSAIFLLIGSALENAIPVTAADFRVVYYSARCLLEHRDPYNESDLKYTYRVDGGETANDTPTIRRTETQYIYFPSAFPITVPFAVFPFGLAHILWLAVTAGSLILSAFLMWDVGASYAPVLSGALVGLLLANCELFLAVGNPGGIAIGLCVIAAWCFIRERCVPVGVVCMALSLMLKPQDSGLIWVYFFLAGGANRKRAIQTLLVIVGLSLPATLWLSHIAPNWTNELPTNLFANSAHGDLSDPGPASSAGHGIGMMIDLQTVISVFRDDPKFYNPVAYFVAGSLILIWIIRTMRVQYSQRSAWFALAPIVALSMLPVYHRLYDAKVLLLAIPACAMLKAKGGAIAWSASLLNAAAILLTGGFPWAIFFRLLKYLPLPASPGARTILIVLQVFPVPLTLLAFGVFFLHVYSVSGTEPNEREKEDGSKQSPAC
jgi:hypothetical protein